MVDHHHRAAKLLAGLPSGARAWTELERRVIDALEEARAEGYAQGAFDARRDFATFLRGAISAHMRPSCAACGHESDRHGEDEQAGPDCIGFGVTGDCSCEGFRA